MEQQIVIDLIKVKWELTESEILTYLEKYLPNKDYSSLDWLAFSIYLVRNSLKNLHK